LQVAKGSVGEARSQLYVALDQEYLNQTRFDELKEMAAILSRRIATFIAYLEKYQNNSRVRKPAKR
jgi:four helix bundle protein